MRSGYPTSDDDLDGRYIPSTSTKDTQAYKVTSTNELPAEKQLLGPTGQPISSKPVAPPFGFKS